MSLAIQQTSQLSIFQNIKEKETCMSRIQRLTHKKRLVVPCKVVQARQKSTKHKGLPQVSLPLGHPLPLDEHACSVSLPTWSSVVGYEEGSPQVTEKLACGYPRFVYHPYVINLMNTALEVDKKLQSQHNNTEQSVSIEPGWDCIVLPSRNSALRCHDFLVKACGYLDGRAASPRLVDSNLSQIVGSSRIQLFSCDNAIDKHDDSVFDGNKCYNAESPIRVLDLNAAEAHAVIFPAQTVFAIEAKSYWQHTGEVMSSRRAEAALNQLGACDGTGACKGVLPRVTSSFHNKNCTGDESNYAWEICPYTNQPHLALYPSEKKSCENQTNNGTTSESEIDPSEGIKERIASIVGTPSSNVFLTPSGMASIYAALRSARRRSLESSEKYCGGTSVVFGFPYLDTLKMCSRPELVPGGVEFFGHGNDKDLASLEQMLKDRKTNNEPGISVLITEFPSNPLLNCHDLKKLRLLADEYDFAVVVDDTIGNFANIDLIKSGLADLVCTSLTKLFNGRGDAMAGSVVANPNTKIGQWLQRDLNENHRNDEGLWVGDAYAINSNSVDFLSRSSQINKTTEALADWLLERDEVASVYYPKFTNPSRYNSVMNQNNYEGKHTAGYGGLFAIILHPHICQRTFYDKLDLSKGPSLGTDFSLVCPYTLLAHYHELDFAMSYGVQPNLLRFAIGLEELDTLKDKFTTAFKESKLHPKLPPKSATVDTTISRGYCSLTFTDIDRSRSLLTRANQSRKIGNRLSIYSVKSNKHFEDEIMKRSVSTTSRKNSSNVIDLHSLGLLRDKASRQNAGRAFYRILTLL